MVKSIAPFALLSLMIASAQGQTTTQISGAWRQSGVKWTKPPAELHLDERSAQAGLLYFGPNGQFALIYGNVIQGANRETLSHGDGQVVYLGKWTFDRAILQVEYRLVSRTVHRQGEELPGPLEKKMLQSKDGVLFLDKTRFQRDELLDAQLLAVYQGETARRGSEGQP